jgi:hypothetical protein
MKPRAFGNSIRATPRETRAQAKISRVTEAVDTLIQALEYDYKESVNKGDEVWADRTQRYITGLREIRANVEKI